MERLIADIKSDFRSNIDNPFKKTIRAARGKVDKLSTEINTKKQWGEKENKKLINDYKKAIEKLQKLEEERDDIESNKIYENAFEWRFEFPEVLNDDGEFVGFDVVIGNPPYIRVQDLQHNLIDYYKSTFVVAHKRIDISILFIELGHKILSPKGYLSYITSNQFLKAEYGRAIRGFLKGYLQVNIDYSKVSVFDGLATYVSVFLITKEKGNTINYLLVDNTDQTPENFAHFDVSNLSDEPWDFNTDQTLKTKLFSDKETLNDICNFTYGVITGLDKAFLVPSEMSDELGLEKEITKKFIRPQNYKKYNIFSQTFNLIYPYNSDNTIIKEPELKANYPNCFQFLKQFKTELENRKDSRTTIKEKGIEWYSIMRRVDISEIATEKIIFYDVGMLPNFMIDTDNHIFGGGTSHSIRLTEEEYLYKYILGVLNSKLMQWIIYDLCPVKMGNARKYGLDYIKKLPIKKAEIKIQNEVAELVDKVISIKKDGLETTDLENQIDQLVYQLYGLTEEEIKIITKTQ
jgi:adenine-specific DNA-methyltransferase